MILLLKIAKTANKKYLLKYRHSNSFKTLSVLWAFKILLD